MLLGPTTEGPARSSGGHARALSERGEQHCSTANSKAVVAATLLAVVPEDVTRAHRRERFAKPHLSELLRSRLGQRFGPNNLHLERADRRKNKIARWRVLASPGGAGVPGIASLSSKLHATPPREERMQRGAACPDSPHPPRGRSLVGRT